MHRTSITCSRENALLRPPDAILAAQVHEAHQIEHPIVVATLAGGDWRIPQRFRELLGARLVGGRKSCNGVGADKPRSVIFSCRSLPWGCQLAVQCVDRAVRVDALGEKEALDAVAQLLLGGRLLPPRPIHAPVAGRAPCVI